MTGVMEDLSDTHERQDRPMVGGVVMALISGRECGKEISNKALPALNAGPRPVALSHHSAERSEPASSPRSLLYFSSLVGLIIRQSRARARPSRPARSRSEPG